MSETLYTHDIFHSMTATDVFAKDAGLMVARPKRGCMPCIMIPRGFHALVTYNGAEIEKNGSYVWGSGCKCASCLTGISHLVTKQYVVFDAPQAGGGYLERLDKARRGTCMLTCMLMCMCLSMCMCMSMSTRMRTCACM